MISNYDTNTARWGEPPTPTKVTERATQYLITNVGIAEPTPALQRAEIAVTAPVIEADAREALIAAVDSAGYSDDDDARLAHSGGFSYLDLLERRGDMPPTPDAVVSPDSHEQVAAVIKACVDHNLALVPFGGGTSVVGGVRPEVGAHAGVVAVSFDRMAQLHNVDALNMTVTVGPGMTGPTLERLLQARGLTLGHLPQSWERASIGGYAATRSSGQSSAGYGRSNEMVERLKVATPRGTFNLGCAPGSAAGPDLRQLFIGSEGAFGIITEVTMRVRQNPIEKRYEGIMFPSYQAGLDAMRELVVRRAKADVMRLSDDVETATNLTMALDGKKAVALEKYLKLRRVDGGALAILGWEGTHTQVGSRRDEAWRVLRKYKAASLGRTVGEGWEHSRFSGPYLRDTLLDMGYLVETLETATGWRELPALRESIAKVLKDNLSDGGAGPLVMAHLSHVYDTGGSLYVTVIARRDAHDPIGQWKRAKKAASEVIVAAGATITHHHGVGRDHAPWLAPEIGDDGVALLREVKQYLDPTGTLNPGALIP